MKIYDFAAAVKSNPNKLEANLPLRGRRSPTGELLGILKPGTNQTQPVVSLSNLPVVSLSNHRRGRTYFMKKNSFYQFGDLFEVGVVGGPEQFK